ncbi:MAG: insulinase family protein [Cyclobacteriaceae bacterium]|nr:insulinase family protein [Cyclobacteriaceae bacterium]
MSLIMGILFTSMIAGLMACGSEENKKDGSQLSIDYEKYTLDNGLDVILHQDDSDPIVAVAVLVHVGSSRERPGLTGFAHFFEHMLFQRSENVPEGAFFKNINDLGGTFNGGTSNDFTVYYQVVPNNALERILWMEADRMGFFINSVTLKSLEEEKPVVKNEKRQNYDNRPYGHTSYVINKALYDESHPYNWEVIGELEDIQGATLDDVKEFYDKWYGPNNATLVITGDFKNGQAKEWVEKYFGEIPARGERNKIEPQPSSLKETKMFYHEDQFAKVPELRMVFPTVEQYHEDYWALNALGNIFSRGKRAPLYKVLVEERKLASNPYTFNRSQEIAGSFNIVVRANDGVDLNDVKEGIEEAMARFEKDGVDERDLNRIKAFQETSYYNGISSVLSKAFQLSQYNEFAGSPDFINEDIDRILAVTEEDIMSVYNRYIKDKPFVLTSFVPQGQVELAVADSDKAYVKIESEDEYVVPEFDDDVDNFERTASAIDRSVEPPLGDLPMITAPKPWSKELSNGMKVKGIYNDELPLVNFRMDIKGGVFLESENQKGLTDMLAELLQEGTANKTPEELQDALGELGSSVNIFASTNSLIVSGNALSRNFDATIALVEEMLLEPRFDEQEFERIKQKSINNVRQADANPNAIAGRIMNKALYGKAHARARYNTKEVLEEITLEDLKAFYNAHFSPSVTTFMVAGAVEDKQVMQALSGMKEKWESKDVEIPSYEPKGMDNQPVILFADVPNSSQSVIRLGNLTVAADDDDFYPLSIANYNLGSYAGAQLFQVLREEKGYTYGAYSSVSRNPTDLGSFMAFSSVQSKFTPESIELFHEIISQYGENYTQEDLDKAREATLRKEAREYETLGQKLGMLANMNTYNLPPNYVELDQKVLKNMTVEDSKAMVDQYMNVDNFVYVVVGDKATLLERIKDLNLAPVVEVDIYGNRLDEKVTMN